MAQERRKPEQDPAEGSREIVERELERQSAEQPERDRPDKPADRKRQGEQTST